MESRDLLFEPYFLNYLHIWLISPDWMFGFVNRENMYFFTAQYNVW